MVIVDFSNVMLSNLHMSLKGHTNMQLDESMLRHMVLNSIRSYRTKFKAKYGDDFVIAFDDKQSWRKQIFPYYKIRRKVARDKSELDWPFIMETFNKFYEELKGNFPYRVIRIEGAEADDIIGVLAKKTAQNPDEKVLIISEDKDFKALCVDFHNIDLYNPISGTKRSYKNVDKDFLKEHIIRGDVGDDVPNVLSQDDTFAIGKRQKVMTQKRFAELMDNPIERWPDEARRNFSRNDTMINLNNVPAAIQTAIVEEFDAEVGKGRSHLYNYFVQNRLKNLMENITEF
jgi:hypothetical protein